MMNMNQQQASRPGDFPFLQVVALGGEPIPKPIVHTWVRRRQQSDITTTTTDSISSCRLFATYGVTEACLYQTMGGVQLFPRSENAMIVEIVGKLFGGMHILICKEE
jgi:acyl-CoA synthetase (AMP-forming)/AMP-acid ligase II